MTDPYAEQTDWAGAAWALTIWAVHFTLLWSASSVWPDQAAARWAALIVTVLAAAALFVLWRRRVRSLRPSVPALGIGMAAAAILFGTLPPIIG